MQATTSAERLNHGSCFKITTTSLKEVTNKTRYTPHIWAKGLWQVLSVGIWLACQDVFVKVLEFFKVVPS